MGHRSTLGKMCDLMTDPDESVNVAEGLVYRMLRRVPWEMVSTRRMTASPWSNRWVWPSRDSVGRRSGAGYECLPEGMPDAVALFR